MAYNNNPYKPVMFFGLSLCIPWVLWFVAAYISHLPDAIKYKNIQLILMLVGLFTPMMLAMWLIFKNPTLTQIAISRLRHTTKISIYYFIIALFLPVTALMLAQLISVGFGYGIEQFHISGQASFTSLLLSPWLMISMAAVVEELAWHGYGMDALNQRFTLFLTSLLFTLYWAFWHLPLVFIKGYYHSEMVAQGPLYTINFILSMVIFVLLINWFYIKSGRNVLIAVLFHLGANVGNEIFATHPMSKVIQTGILAVILAVILYRERQIFWEKYHLTSCLFMVK